MSGRVPGGRSSRRRFRLMKKPEIAEFFRRLAAALPVPKTELEYANPYTLLVAVVLSAQATDKGVNKATARLFPVASTPQAFVKLGVDGLIPYISSIGLFNMKAKNVIALSQRLIDGHGGQVPRDRDALEKLPGVGRKTANVVLNVAFGEPTIAVDTHIFRVANRTRLAVGKDPEAVERQLLKFTPEEFRHNAHHWLILHGRYVCVARVPRCPQCVIADLCEYTAKTQALPGPDPRALPLEPPAAPARPARVDAVRGASAKTPRKPAARRRG